MAINYQFNKTSLQQVEKLLKVRVRALPTIKNKESALRIEVKRAKADYESYLQQLNRKYDDYKTMAMLWNEFDATLLRVSDIKLSARKIAGVRIPVFEGLEFETRTFSLFNSPQWYFEGMQLLKELADLSLRAEVLLQKMQLLEFARKKTTQKVNLFEKVQIPGYEDAIRKIKRFLEDEDNLSKASQKIVKARQQKAEEEK